jgi:hypothetical protein
MLDLDHHVLAGAKNTERENKKMQMVEERWKK